MAKKKESKGIGFKLGYETNPETLTETEEEREKMKELNQRWRENTSKWVDELRKIPMPKLSVTYTEPKSGEVINTKRGMSYE